MKPRGKPAIFGRAGNHVKSSRPIVAQYYFIYSHVNVIFISVEKLKYGTAVTVMTMTTK